MLFLGCLRISILNKSALLIMMTYSSDYLTREETRKELDDDEDE